jgi:hypothetical protein
MFGVKSQAILTQHMHTVQSRIHSSCLSFSDLRSSSYEVVWRSIIEFLISVPSLLATSGTSCDISAVMSAVGMLDAQIA